MPLTCFLPIPKFLLALTAKLCAAGISEVDDEYLVQKKCLGINIHIGYLGFCLVFIPYLFCTLNQYSLPVFLPFRLYVVATFACSVTILGSYPRLKHLRPLYYSTAVYGIPLPYIVWVCSGCFDVNSTPCLPWSLIAVIVVLVLGRPLEARAVYLAHILLPLVPLFMESRGCLR